MQALKLKPSVIYQKKPPVCIQAERDLDSVSEHFSWPCSHCEF